MLLPRPTATRGSRRLRGVRALGALAFAVAAWLAMPGSALAVSVSIGPGRFGSPAMIARDTVKASNEVGIERAADGLSYLLSDGAGVSAAAPCTLTAPGVASCPVSAFPGEAVNVFAGGGSDRILLAQQERTAYVIRAGDGNDRVFGSRDGDLIFGEAGADSISGDRGADTLHGGAGADRLVGSEGDDFLGGGPGDDLLFGGAGRDLLAGNGGDDRCVGRPGPGRLRGCESR